VFLFISVLPDPASRFKAQHWAHLGQVTSLLRCATMPWFSFSPFGIFIWFLFIICKVRNG